MPHRCAVIPGRASDPEGFVVTGNILTGWDSPVEISVAGAKEIGRVVGMVPKEHVETLIADAQALTAELAIVKDRLGKLEQIRELEAEVVA